MWVVKGADQPSCGETLHYLSACEDFRNRRHDSALAAFTALAELPAGIELTHFRLPVRDMALLRGAQVEDLAGKRQSAASLFNRLAEQTACPELNEIATLHSNKTFSIPSTMPTMLLREFNLDLHRYKRHII